MPVLAGSAGYAVAETFGWEGSLEMPARGAPGFYLIVAAATLAGLVAALTPLDPIRMLFWSAVVNGIVAVPLMIAMMMVVASRKIMGKFAASRGADDLRLVRHGADGVVVAAMLDSRAVGGQLELSVTVRSRRCRSTSRRSARGRRHAAAPDKPASASRSGAKRCA